jgi:hypothetical protein
MLRTEKAVNSAEAQVEAETESKKQKQKCKTRKTTMKGGGKGGANRSEQAKNDGSEDQSRLKENNDDDVNQKDEEDDEDQKDEEDEADEADEDAPPPPHVNINGVVWVTRKKNTKKRKKSSISIPVEYFELPALPEQSEPDHKRARSGTALWKPGVGKCFVKQRFQKCDPIDDNDLKEVAIERSERMIQIANERERADEEEANLASKFNMNTSGPRRKKNVSRSRRR